MTCKRTMNKIIELTGIGDLIYMPRKKYNDNSKDQWSWCIAAKNAQKVLKLIKPYSVTKKEHVKLGLKFQKRISNFQAFSGQPIPQKEIDQRETMKLTMNKLNKRGIK